MSSACAMTPGVFRMQVALLVARGSLSDSASSSRLMRIRD
jgi:hypothetical protein